MILKIKIRIKNICKWSLITVKWTKIYYILINFSRKESIDFNIRENESIIQSYTRKEKYNLFKKYSCDIVYFFFFSFTFFPFHFSLRPWGESESHPLSISIFSTIKKNSVFGFIRNSDTSLLSVALQHASSCRVLYFWTGDKIDVYKFGLIAILIIWNCDGMIFLASKF